MVIERLMLRFLELNYPVLKIKVHTKFRRCIALNDKIYVLGDSNSMIMLKNELSNLLMDLFHCDHNTSIMILQGYLE